MTGMLLNLFRTSLINYSQFVLFSSSLAASPDQRCAICGVHYLGIIKN